MYLKVDAVTGFLNGAEVLCIVLCLHMVLYHFVLHIVKP